MKHLKVPNNVAGSNDLEGYAALQTGAAIVERQERWILRLAGRDPIGMLNAIVTNGVPIQGDRGAYAMLLDPKGRIQTDLRIIKADDEILIDTEPEGAKAAKEIVGRYAPFSRVSLEELSGSWSVLGLYGPRATELLGNPDLAEHETIRAEIGGTSILIVGVAVPVGGYAYETARIAGSVPRFGTDITPENFPGESENSLGRAVDFGKGCYPGQETVARMHYRGSPNKRHHRFELEPGPMKPPEAGDEILQGEKKLAGPISSVDVVGRLTSVAPLQVDGKSYALGYLARKADLQAAMRAEDAKVLAATPA